MLGKPSNNPRHEGIFCGILADVTYGSITIRGSP